MPRFYFDTRDNDGFVADDSGHDLASVQIAKEEAARALVDLARDVLPAAVVRTLFNRPIDVRDDQGPVLWAILRFDVEHVREGI